MLQPPELAPVVRRLKDSVSLRVQKGVGNA